MNFTVSLYGGMNCTATPIGTAGAKVTLPLASVVSGARSVHNVPPPAPIVPELPVPPFGV